MGKVSMFGLTALIAALVVLAGCGSDGTVVGTSRARADRTTTSSAPTTTTTLSPAACLTEIAEVQAGARPPDAAQYATYCGALPAGVVLDRTTTTTTTTTAPPPPTTTTTVYIPPPPPPPSNCNPNYAGCVPNASDVDCAGGSGNGPAYVSGPVQVTGVDVYGLDSDGDGWGCE